MRSSCVKVAKGAKLVEKPRAYIDSHRASPSLGAPTRGGHPADVDLAHRSSEGANRPSSKKSFLLPLQRERWSQKQMHGLQLLLELSTPMPLQDYRFLREGPNIPLNNPQGPAASAPFFGFCGSCSMSSLHSLARAAWVGGLGVRVAGLHSAARSLVSTGV